LRKTKVMTKVRMQSRAAAILIGFALLSWSSVTRPANRRPFGGVLRIPVIETIETTDPARITSEVEWLIARQLHESLFRVTADGGLVPALAQALPQESEDGLELLIQLRPGLIFHDGSEVTAGDVIASWHRLLDPATESPHWWLLAPIKGALGFRQGKLTRISGLEKVNRLSIRVRLRIKVPDFPRALAAVPAAILPASARRRTGAGANHPTGAGCFGLPKERTGGEFGLVPELRHWRGRPYLDAVQFKDLEGPKKADLAFELGRVDWAFGKPRRASDFREWAGPVDQQVFLVVNPKLLANYPEGLRRALLQAIDRQALANYVYGDRGRAADELLLSQGLQGASLTTPPDSAKARAYFKEHYLGKAAEDLLKRGALPKLKFIVRRDRPGDLATAERIQVDLMDVGVSVIVLPLPVGEYRQQVAAGDFDFRLARPLGLAGTVEMQLIAAVARIQGEVAVEELLAALARLPEDGSRAGIVRERARGYQVQVAWLPLLVHGRRLFVRDVIRGLGPAPDGRADLCDVWLAEPTPPSESER